MRRVRETLVLVLLALLPFHALGVTVLTRVFAGQNQPPMGVLALWKEALLALVLVLACVEWMTTKRPGDQETRRLDVLDVCIVIVALSLLFASFLASWSLGPSSLSPSFIYGIRYDIVPLAAFVLLRRVPWSDAFLKRLPFVLAAVIGIVAAYALLTLALPDAFFRALGYGDLHSLYVPGRPVAAFQQIGGTALHRLQGTFSGPNQLGIWLAMGLPFVLALRPAVRRWVWSSVLLLLLLSLLLTFSRAAWIATAVILVITLWPHVRRLSVTAVTVLCIGILAISLSLLWLFPSVIVRIESSAGHLRNPLSAAAIMMKNPVGAGLGSAGPANNRVADACVFLEEGSDASWAAAHGDLCVFVDNAQVQPAPGERACTCPLLPENWYLQLGVEGGWIAFLSFIVLTVLLLRRLHSSTRPLSHLVFLSFLAVSIAALFLHAWEDAAVAYTVWILLAVTLSASLSKPSARSEPLL